MIDFKIGDAGKAISGLFTGIREAFTGEKIKDPQALAELEYKFKELETRWMDYDSKVTQYQHNVIIAEAQGGSWIQRNWRPLTMLTFVGIIVAYWFGFQPENVSQETLNELFALIKIGLGGYVVGRSGEKIAKSYFDANKG